MSGGYGGGYGGQRSGNGGAGYGQGGGYGGGQGQQQVNQGGYTGKKKEYPLPTTFDQAKAYKVNFGKYKGQTLNQIAVEDEGLRYIAWLGDNCDGEKFADTYAALSLFLGEPRVQEAIKALPAEGSGRF